MKHWVTGKQICKDIFASAFDLSFFQAHTSLWHLLVPAWLNSVAIASVMTWICYVSPKTHVLKIWFLLNAAMFNDRAFGRRLDHEGSKFISGWVHWRIHNLMSILGGDGNCRGEAELRGMGYGFLPSDPQPRPQSLPFWLFIFLCFSASRKWLSLLPHMLSTLMFGLTSASE